MEQLFSDRALTIPKSGTFTHSHNPQYNYTLGQNHSFVRYLQTEFTELAYKEASL